MPRSFAAATRSSTDDAPSRKEWLLCACSSIKPAIRAPHRSVRTYVLARRELPVQRRLRHVREIGRGPVGSGERRGVERRRKPKTARARSLRGLHATDRVLHDETLRRRERERAAGGAEDIG